MLGSIEDIVFAGDRFFCNNRIPLGPGRGDLYRTLVSADGKKWDISDSTSSFAGELKSVAYDGTRFIALSNSNHIYTVPILLASKDGYNWEKIYEWDSSSTINTVNWYNNKLIVAGSFKDFNGRNRLKIASSADGKIWTDLIQTPPLGSFHSLGVCCNKIVAMGSNGNIFQPILYTSNDGQSWQQVTSLDATFFDITCAFNKCYAAGYGGIYSTTDGLTWKGIYQYLGSRISDIAGNGQWMVATPEKSSSDSTNYILVTSDGLTWKKDLVHITFGSDLRYTETEYGNNTFVVLQVSISADPQTVIYTSKPPSAVNRIASIPEIQKRIKFIGNKLQYTLTSVSHISITLFDIHGRLIKNLINENQISGTYTTTLPHLVQGTYIISFKAGSHIENNTLVIGPEK